MRENGGVKYMCVCVSGLCDAAIVGVCFLLDGTLVR